MFINNTKHPNVFLEAHKNSLPNELKPYYGNEQFIIAFGLVCNTEKLFNVITVIVIKIFL